MSAVSRSVNLLPRGTALSRFIMGLGVADTVQAIEIAEANWASTPQVAAMLKTAIDPGTLTGWGQPLALYGIAAEVLELLRPATIVDRLAPLMRKIPFRMKVAREVSVAASAWVGENAPIPSRAPAFDTVQQEAYKTATIVVISRELLRFSNPNAEAELRQQLIKAIAQFLDTQFLDPTVTTTAVNPGSITSGAEAVTSTGSTAAQILADLLSMLGKLTTNNTPFTSPVWILRPGTAITLAGKYTTAGTVAFPDIRANGGTLLGINVMTSNSSPAQITLLDASQILLSDDGNVNIESSGQASLQMSDAPSAGATTMVSLYANNLFALRAGREIAWQPVHADYGSPNVTRGVTYMSVSY